MDSPQAGAEFWLTVSMLSFFRFHIISTRTPHARGPGHKTTRHPPGNHVRFTTCSSSGIQPAAVQNRSPFIQNTEYISIWGKIRMIKICIKWPRLSFMLTTVFCCMSLMINFSKKEKQLTSWIHTSLTDHHKYKTTLFSPQLQGLNTQGWWSAELNSKCHVSQFWEALFPVEVP